MNNKHYFKKAFVLLMEASVLTSGVSSCANMSDTTTTYAQATGIGAASGAGVGALAGQAIGGDTKSTVTGAAIGGVIGAIAGWFWGDSVVQQKKEYASVEEQIRHSNQVMDKLITQTKARNAELAQAIANLKKENKNIASSDVKTKSQKMAKEVDGRISILNEEVTLARKAANNADRNQRIALQGKISTLNKEIKSLAKHKKALSTLSA
ncbi:glycine zipper domain-containing protein [Akkermansia sp. N21116]|uniref:glycine zipper domain-containing protein n=1 Tax=Akkermansia sp. N21116 TaxID=3040764 RepID=UPI00244E96B7|nr:glycine zipper domain-containing protein [Akkermansia sp. N21116]WPX41165.1 glycine zipper domain-containing protein [Akkermansia sp. N21116]